MIKKLEYIAENLLTPFLRDNYPLWGELIKGYLSYLDNSFYSKIINLTDNNNSFTIYPELLDDYLDLYFNGMIDMQTYQLTDDNKRIYIALSKYIFGLKGNVKALDFLFRSLSDVQVLTDNGFITIDQIDIDYYEDESWWPDTYPFTYKFTVDESYTGEEGMTLFEKNGEVTHIPALTKEVYDVTGAGDTVISVLTLALTAGATIKEAAVIANYAAGIVVGEVGTATVTRGGLAEVIAKKIEEG